MAVYETQCCGIRELDGVERATTESIMSDAARDWFEEDIDGAFMFFSVTQQHIKKGRNLAAYITKHNLGSVFKTKSTLNPNSENMLTMWVWTVNKKNFERWYQKNVKGK